MFALGAFIYLSQGYNHEIQSTHDMNGSFGSKCSGPSADHEWIKNTFAGFGDSVDLGLSPHYLLASYI